MNPVGSCSKPPPPRAKIAIRCVTRENNGRKRPQKNFEILISHSDDDEKSPSEIRRRVTGKNLQTFRGNYLPLSSVHKQSNKLTHPLLLD